MTCDAEHTRKSVPNIFNRFTKPHLNVFFVFVLMSCYHLNPLLHQLQIDRFIDSIGCTLIHFCSRTPFFLILPEPVVRSTKKASCSSARGDSTPTEQIIESSMLASDSYLCKGLGLMKLTTYPLTHLSTPNAAVLKGGF